MHCSALLNHEEEEVIENVSYHSLLTRSQSHIKRECLIPLSLTRSQFQIKRVSHTILTDPKSVSSEESVSYHSYWPEVSFIDPRSISQESVSNHSYWSQINGGHPNIGSTLDTTMRPSIVLLWSLTSFPCSLIRWELLPMSPRLHG